MKNLLLLLLFSISFTATVFCQQTVVGNGLNYNLVSPPKTTDANSLYQYLYVLYQRWMVAQISVSEPNGFVDGSVGSIIIYNNNGTYYLAVETSDPNGTVWKGVALGAI